MPGNDSRAPVDVGASWIETIVRLGGDRLPAQGSGADLVARYGQAHRRYHTLTHVGAVLRDSGELTQVLGVDDPDGAAVALAACAHDVVYDASPGQDERESAAWAGRALAAAGLAAPEVDRVQELVLMTLAHACDPADPGATALLDADLAVLALPADRYAGYVRAVRAEYAGVTDAQWRAGRSEVLSALLGRERLYLSEPGYARWESAARSNVAAELAQLAADV